MFAKSFVKLKLYKIKKVVTDGQITYIEIERLVYHPYKLQIYIDVVQSY